MEWNLSYKEIITNTGWLTPFLTITGLCITLILSVRSFNKQLKLQVNRERLEIVYFPLETAIKSYSNSTCKAFDLYWYLKDRMQDEKYTILIRSKTVISQYLYLEDYFEANEPVMSTKKENILYRNLVFAINKEYRAIKKKTGYELQALANSFRWFLTAYFTVCFGAAAGKGTEVVPDLVWIAILAFCAVLLFFVICIVYLIIGIKNEWPFFKRNILIKSLSIKQRYENKYKKKQG